MKSLPHGFFNSQKPKKINAVTVIGPRIVPRTSHSTAPYDASHFTDPYNCMACEQQRALCYLHAKIQEKGIAPAKYRPWDIWTT
jgi:hypothetical protein